MRCPFTICQAAAQPDVLPQIGVKALQLLTRWRLIYGTDFVSQLTWRLEQGEIQEVRLNSSHLGRLSHPAQVDRIALGRPGH